MDLLNLKKVSFNADYRELFIETDEKQINYMYTFE